MQIVRIEDLQDPRLDAFRDLRTNNTSRDQSLFIAEGSTVVRRLFDSDFETVSVLVSDRKWPKFSPFVPDNVQVFRVPHELASRLVGFDFHVGILASGRRRPSPDLSELLAQADARRTLIVAPHITDPENVGALIRIGAAFGVTAVVFGHKCSDPFSRRVLRVSMANGLFLPVVQTDDVAAALTAIRSAGIQIVGTVLDEHAESLESVQPGVEAAIVFGNETHGLDSQWVACCDRRVTIPMRGGTDSLNVSVSAAVFLFWFTRSAMNQAPHPGDHGSDG